MDRQKAIKRCKSCFWEYDKFCHRPDKGPAIGKLDEIKAAAAEASLPGWAAVADAARLQLDKKWPEAQSLLEALPAAADDSGGFALFLRANGHYEQKHCDLAINLYGRVLEASGFDAPGVAWNNMGTAYDKKKEFDRAIECYRKALDTRGYDTPGITWNNMGFAHAGKKEFDRAFECYQKALDTRGYDTPGITWHNMGFTYAGKKEFDRAIECYQKALDTPAFDTPGITWYNMAVAYRQSGQNRKAAECWKSAAECYDKAGESEEAAVARRMAQLVASRPEKLSPQDRALAENAPPVEPVPTKKQSLGVKFAAGTQTAYDEYLRRTQEPTDIMREPHVLAVLKEWGSSIPLVHGGQVGCRGGGYFLVHDGQGMVIDPGFDFLHNFHEAGFHATQIKAVVVSHDHPDHNHDLMALDTLMYELAGKDPRLQYDLLRDDATAANIDLGDPGMRQRKSMCTFGWSRGGQTIGFPQSKLPFTICPFEARHGRNHAVGFKLVCHGHPQVKIGFSCDTQFYPELCQDDHLGGCDILVLHISQPDPQEFTNDDFMKPLHLGFNGVERLIRECKPKLAIVCEFWGGYGDHRLDIIHALREECQTEAILPGGIGLMVRPSKLEVRCTACNKWIPADKIKVAGPDRRFGTLSYLCSDCHL